jgi:hypothetical protein
VPEYVERVRPDAVAPGQEGVSAAKYLLIARGACGFGAEEVWDPPGAQLATEEQHVADSQPLEKPIRIGLAQMDGAGHEPECVWRGIE